MLNRLSSRLAVLIIASACGLAFASAWDDAPVFDEVAHIPAGYSYVVRHDNRLNPEHPPLVKDLAGLALLPLGLHQTAFETGSRTWGVNDEWDFGRILMFSSGNDADRILRAARLPMLAFLALSAGLVHSLARQLYGRLAALIALCLFAFSPTVLAHGRLVTTDMAALAGVLLTTRCYLAFLERQRPAELLRAAAAFGIAQVTKFSALLLIPYLLLLASFWILVGQPSRHLFVRTVAIIVLGYAWLDAYTPETVIGYSIFVWRFTPEQQSVGLEDRSGGWGH